MEVSDAMILELKAKIERLTAMLASIGPTQIEGIDIYAEAGRLAASRQHEEATDEDFVDAMLDVWERCLKG